MQGNRKTWKKTRKYPAKISKVLPECYSKTCSEAIEKKTLRRLSLINAPKYPRHSRQDRL